MSSAVETTPGATQEHPVEVVRDRPYQPGGAQTPSKGRLDLYLPRGEASFPVVVSVHGGALLEGDKSEQELLGRRFALAGVGAAMINYRLSPEVSHPAHVQDVAAAFAWVKGSIAAHGGLADRVFVIGHSAGAYLATLLAADGRYLAAHGLAPVDIRGLVAVSGFFWVDRVAPERPKTVWGEDARAWVDASPAHYLSRPRRLPPSLFIYADGDDALRRQQSLDIVRAARAAGNEQVSLLEARDRDHVSIWNCLAAPGDEVARHIIAFVRAEQTESLGSVPPRSSGA